MGVISRVQCPWCANFIHDALWFDASHAAVCVRLHHEMMQDISWFDANCSVSQRDYSP